MEEHEDHHQGDERAYLTHGRHAAEDRAALVLGGQAHAQRYLRLYDHVQPEAPQERPGDDGPEAVRDCEQAEAEAEHDQGAGGELLQGDAVEDGGHEDEDESPQLSDGGPVAELGS